MKNENEIKAVLEKERKLVVNELGEIGVVKNKKSPDDWEGKPMDDVLPADPNEVADRITSYEGNSAIVSELEQRVMEIDHALNKLKLGKYGKCEVCGKEIEADKLEANPASRTCIEHKEAKLPETPDLG